MEFLQLMEFLTVIVPHYTHCAFTLCIQLLLRKDQSPPRYLLKDHAPSIFPVSTSPS